MQNHLRAAAVFANLLDNQFNFFGIKFGAGFLINLIPYFGDIATALLSLYIVWIGIKMNIPGEKVAQMIFNIFINFVFGLIPVLGDSIYLFRHANLKNLEILKQYAKNPTMDANII